MTVALNHTIVHSRDPQRSAAFMADILGRPKPVRFLHFHVVELDNSVTLDFIQTGEVVLKEHYAFLVGEQDFDEILQRIVERRLPYWADPGHQQPGVINHYFGGRGVYWDDPDGHVLEIITKPYAVKDDGDQG
ncbi:MAG TPA: VOC family protein [Burkholderiaceae bacterium]|nr:VOC family protein [Burkholderiaceae bacterium]